MFKSLSSLLKTVDDEENTESFDLAELNEVEQLRPQTFRSNYNLPKSNRNNTVKMENRTTMEIENRASVAVIKIDSLNAANLAAEALRDGKTVICNYEEIDPQLAQRASDFIRGAATVLHAKFCPVSHKITVFVPSGTSLISDLQEKKDDEIDYHEDLYNQLYLARN